LIFLYIEVAISPKLPTATPTDKPEEFAKKQFIQGLELADPHLGGKIDIIVGTNHLPLFWREGQPRKFSPEDRITAINTIFGWTVSGPMATKKGVSMKVELVENNDSALFRRLYELKQVPQASTLTPEEQSATQQFNDTIKQHEDGKYSCKLPRVSNPPQLGDSKSKAKARFFQNERKMKRQGAQEAFNKELTTYVTNG